jgi:hypothetical protein
LFLHSKNNANLKSLFLDRTSNLNELHVFIKGI